LVAIRPRLAVHHDAAGVDVRLMIVRDRGSRRDRAQKHVEVGEELGAARDHLRPCFQLEAVVAYPGGDVARMANWRGVIVRPGIFGNDTKPLIFCRRIGTAEQGLGELLCQLLGFAQGAAARLLAAALGRTERAASHFTSAIAMHDRLGTPAWAQLSRLELDHLQVVVQSTNVFRKDGSTWRLAFDGQEVHLTDAKGLHDIATLLGTPGREVHVWTLLGSPVPRGGADPVLDEQARALFAARLAELDTEIAEADAGQDVLRSERACAERAALVHELAAASGLGKRRRRLCDDTERARKTVGARIRDVLVRIERVHPVLADHLRTAISTGTMCVYTPPDGYRWRV
jgi:phage terminase Nu1 subunit (DNA packaging protein)